MTIKRKLRSANEIQIAAIRISLRETKVPSNNWHRVSFETAATSALRPEECLIQWDENK